MGAAEESDEGGVRFHGTKGEPEKISPAPCRISNGCCGMGARGLARALALAEAFLNLLHLFHARILLGPKLEVEPRILLYQETRAPQIVKQNQQVTQPFDFA